MYKVAMYRFCVELLQLSILFVRAPKAVISHHGGVACGATIVNLYCIFMEVVNFDICIRGYGTSLMEECCERAGALSLRPMC